MENKYYLRIEGDSFGFVTTENHEILETDIKITSEDYEEFFNLQTNGVEFKLRQEPIGNTLFDYIEEYDSTQNISFTPNKLEMLEEQLLQQSEYMVDMEYRLTNLELGF